MVHDRVHSIAHLQAKMKLLLLPGHNMEKIWPHRSDVPTRHVKCQLLFEEVRVKGAKPQKFFDFFRLEHGKMVIHDKVRIQ